MDDFSVAIEQLGEEESMNGIITTRCTLFHTRTLLPSWGFLLVIVLTGCATEPTTIPASPNLVQATPPSTILSVSPTADLITPSPLSLRTSQPASPSSRPSTPTLTVAPPSLIARGSPDQLSQTYTNSREHYTVALPPDWTVVTNDVGFAYFLSQASLEERAKGLTDWEASIGGIQFVGRNPKPTENEQYQSSLPNHCSTIDWQRLEINGTIGRIYTLECDNVVGLGTHRRQHVYLPAGHRFVEVWLKVDAQVAGAPVPLLTAMLATLQLDRTSADGSYGISRGSDRVGRMVRNVLRAAHSV